MHHFLVLLTSMFDWNRFKLCRIHNILTVNGQFPGPTVEARDEDSLAIKVVMLDHITSPSIGK